ncbi:MAG: alpha/beta hydrolase, partial [Pseudomonadota bacterium]
MQDTPAPARFPIDPRIDHDFNARESVASFEDAYGALLTLSAGARDALPAPSKHAFDRQSGSTLNLYSAGANTPVFLWIHGGYWRIGSKEDNAFAAPGLVAHGISVAVMDYSLAPAADLHQIVHEVRCAVAWLHAQASGLALDPARIHVGGSSAGGHLVGTLLAGGWQDQYQVPADTIGVALALSGIFDLEPLLHTQVNDWMNMDKRTVSALSPIRHIPAQSTAKLLISVGGKERVGFHRET